MNKRDQLKKLMGRIIHREKKYDAIIEKMRDKAVKLQIRMEREEVTA